MEHGKERTNERQEERICTDEKGSANRRLLKMGDGFVHVPVASQGVTEAIARIRLAEIGSRARSFAPWRLPAPRPSRQAGLGAKTAECRPGLRIWSLFAANPSESSSSERKSV